MCVQWPLSVAYVEAYHYLNIVEWVPNERNERQVGNNNVLIYLHVDVNGKVQDPCTTFNIIYIMRTNVDETAF